MSLNPLRTPIGVEDLAADVYRRWMSAMRRGDLAAAWRQTDRLENIRRFHITKELTEDGGSPFMMWDGSSFHGNRVVIRCRHGLGDTLQFLRFVPLIACHSEVHLMAQPALLALLKDLPGMGQAWNGWTTFEPEHDVTIEIMELAYALRVTNLQSSTTEPYLPAAHIRAVSAFQLANHRTTALPAIGLICNSSAWDPSRSIPWSCIEPLFDLPGEFFLLQQEPCEDRPAFLPSRVVDLGPHTKSIQDAAAAMLDMDLIVSVDTMAIHLAGALGRPAALLLRHESDWRWMSGAGASAWYPTVQLFSQPQPGAWKLVVQGLMQWLAEHPLFQRESHCCP